MAARETGETADIAGVDKKEAAVGNYNSAVLKLVAAAAAVASAHNDGRNFPNSRTQCLCKITKTASTRMAKNIEGV